MVTYALVMIKRTETSFRPCDNKMVSVLNKEESTKHFLMKWYVSKYIKKGMKYSCLKKMHSMVQVSHLQDTDMSLYVQ